MDWNLFGDLISLFWVTSFWGGAVTKFLDRQKYFGLVEHFGLVGHFGHCDLKTAQHMHDTQLTMTHDSFNYQHGRKTKHFATANTTQDNCYQQML